MLECLQRLGEVDTDKKRVAINTC